MRKLSSFALELMEDPHRVILSFMPGSQRLEPGMGLTMLDIMSADFYLVADEHWPRVFHMAKNRSGYLNDQMEVLDLLFDEYRILNSHWAGRGQIEISEGDLVRIRLAMD